MLTFEEREICSRIGGENGLDGQRARALLALDDGTTHADAAAQTGLTLNQVRYCLTQFRRLRLDIFPPELLADPVDPAEQETKAPDPAEGEAAAKELPASAPPEKATIEEKKGKGKKAKKRSAKEEQPVKKSGKKNKGKKGKGPKGKGKKKAATNPNKGNNGQGGKKPKKKKKK